MNIEQLPEILQGRPAPSAEEVYNSPELGDLADREIAAYTGDNSFVRELRTKRKQYRNGLSLKQLAAGLGAIARERGLAGGGQQLDGSFAAIAELFETASRKLKWPAIVLSTAEGFEFKLGLCGDRSKYQGDVRVLGRDFERTYLGRIAKDGTWFPSRDCKAEITAVIRDFAADPAGVAAEFGKRTGACCFCMRELTDARSLEVGYGPICAGHYALPWGEKVAA